MANFIILFLSMFLLLLNMPTSSPWVSAEVVEHTFLVQNLTVERVCQKREIIAVNGKYPGPTIYVHEGDTLIVHVVNKSPHGIAIHWHGVESISAWYDGPAFVTQCPIPSGGSYTYRMNITKQEGTLWWHAHSSWLRATVHGALIIYPKVGRSYPFQKPYKEIPILLGEWWNFDMIDLENYYLYDDMTVGATGVQTINGQPGDFFECSSKDIYKLKVKQGETYLLRIINVGLNRQMMFFKIANHKMTVVSIDACYTDPYVTDVLPISSGQTVDVLLKSDQPPISYYMEGITYMKSDNGLMLHLNRSSSAILIYEGATSPSSALRVSQGVLNKSTVYEFFTSLTGLTSGPHWVPVPKVVDEHMFITQELGVIPCKKSINKNCDGPFGGLIYGNMNNVSFKLPTKMSMLEAFFHNIDGIYTTDFPTEPPIKFDYTNPNNSFNKDLLWIGEFGTKVKKVKYNATIQIVLQNTLLTSEEFHPIHLHGFNFYVVGQGIGNYDSTRDNKKFNLINPQQRNTVTVPAGGWAVIRFQAKNPGVWLMHCHLEMHFTTGLATAFVVENGPSNSTSLPQPPLDLPKCDYFETSDLSEKSIRLASLI